MRKIVFLVAAAAAAFGLVPVEARLGPVLGSLLFVAIAVGLSLSASSSVTALGVGAGALAAFTSGVLGSASTAMAGAALAVLCFAERTVRVRSASARFLHLGVAALCGAVAGSLTSSFAAAAPALRGVSIAVAAVLLALPLLVDADDPIAFALEAAAASLPAGSSKPLREAAELRRSAEEDLLDPEVAREVRAAWPALVKVADARVRLAARKLSPASPAHAVARKLDERIDAHVAALTKALTAADAARAAEVSLDEAALTGVERAGDSLEHMSRAIVDEA